MPTSSSTRLMLMTVEIQAPRSRRRISLLFFLDITCKDTKKVSFPIGYQHLSGSTFKRPKLLKRT